MKSERLLIVSNRLGVSARMMPEGLRLVPSAGGLASGLRPWHEHSDGLWFGWPGAAAPASAQRDEIDRQLAERRMVPVHLSGEQISGYYHGFANGVLWPTFHYLLDQGPIDACGWDAYRDVNAAFADAVAREYRAGDTIWVHDYHLMLVPALLRARLPRARIGFFLHIPFPSSEVFRILPWRREILHGVLGADLVGFHTFAYMRHFVTSLLHLEGIETDIDRIRTGGRESTVGVFPMGVDAAALGDLSKQPDVVTKVDAIRRDAGERRIVLGIDRLDYTKGILRRLDAIESLLARDPSLRDAVRYIQVAVPSRADIDAYQQFRKRVEERVGRINGAYGTVGSVPVHYIHRLLSAQDLVALYRAADVMLVTPLRDGMNLVAKEFVASREDQDGVLILSEFAGAASELDGAVSVNPYDVHALADSIHRALTMPVEERRARMRSLRRRVLAHDAHAWATAFLEQLGALGPSTAPAIRRTASLENLLVEARRTRPIRLLLDYDGTLVPFAASPELAVPDDDLMVLLEQLVRSEGLEVDIVSGRSRDSLDRWFGELPIALWGEHGLWHRPRWSARWEATTAADPACVMRVRPILDQFVAATPGSRVEIKSASIAWHYRGASNEFGSRQAHELRMLLGDVLSNQPLEVLEGEKVIEVRWRGVSKAIVAQRAAQEARAATVIVAIGDDRTDEDLFRELPASSLAVAVGGPRISAGFHLDDYRAVRRVLGLLVAERLHAQWISAEGVPSGTIAIMSKPKTSVARSGFVAP